MTEQMQNQGEENPTPKNSNVAKIMLGALILGSFVLAPTIKFFPGAILLVFVWLLAPPIATAIYSLLWLVSRGKLTSAITKYYGEMALYSLATTGVTYLVLLPGCLNLWKY